LIAYLCELRCDPSLGGAVALSIATRSVNDDSMGGLVDFDETRCSLLGEDDGTEFHTRESTDVIPFNPCHRGARKTRCNPGDIEQSGPGGIDGHGQNKLIIEAHVESFTSAGYLGERLVWVC